MNAELSSNVAYLLSSISRELKAIDTARNRYARALSPNFSCFNYIYTDELMLSRILADLLNPKGSHAQGGIFLELFWNFLRSKSLLPEEWERGWAKADLIEVNTEVETQMKRRMDIYCSTGGVYESYGLCIENKPFAEDQINQLQDYAQELIWLHKERWHLLYLAGYADLPTDSSIREKDRIDYENKKQFSVLKYVDLIDWLKACIAESENEKVSLFLKEFIRFIQRKFAGIKDMSTTNTVKEYVKTPENLSAAFEIYKSLSSVKSDLIKNLETQISKACHSKGWTLRDRTSKSGWILTEGVSENYRWTGITILFRPNQINFAFRIEFFGTNYNQFKMGIVCLKNKKDSSRDKEYEDIYVDIQNLFQTHRLDKETPPSDMWPVKFQVGYANWGNNAEPWRMILENNQMSNQIIEAAEIAYIALEEANLLEQL